MLHTTSSVREWRQCRRRYRYAYVDLIRPARDDVKLAVGTVVHAGLEAWWSGQPFPTPADTIDPVEAARCRAMLRAYDARWGETRGDWQTVAAESVFERPACGAARLGGKLDVAARHVPTGKLYVVEHKTTSEDVATAGSDYWQRLALDLQLLIYQDAVRTIPAESLKNVKEQIVRERKFENIRLQSEQVAGFDYRRYDQTGAYFWQPSYTGTPEYYTGDFRLQPFASNLYTGKLTIIPGLSSNGGNLTSGFRSKTS